jgi:hypothetical protein
LAYHVEVPSTAFGRVERVDDMVAKKGGAIWRQEESGGCSAKKSKPNHRNQFQ